MFHSLANASLSPFMLKHAKRLRNALARFLPATPKEWKDIEYFEESWKERISQMARYIPPRSTVMDLGCGRQWLREYLDQCRYVPVDYRSRSPDTLVCDFNRKEFPDVDVDVCFVSGCLEYVEDPAWFIEQIGNHAKRCVLSYCPVDDHYDLRARASLAWKSNLTKADLLSLFAAAGMRVEAEATSMNNCVFSFVRA